MNQLEFNAWWIYHGTVKPSHATWLAEHGKGVDGCETLVEWQRLLHDVPLSGARQCTEAIAAGVQQCYGADDLIRAVIGWNKHTIEANYNRNPSPTSRPEVFRCHHCHDMGVRTVFHPIAMRAVWNWPEGLPVEKSLNPKLGLTCNVSCTCDAGDRWANPKDPPKGKKKLPRLPVFDENCMVPILGTSHVTSDDIDRLVAHIEKVAANQIRYSELEEWNQG